MSRCYRRWRRARRDIAAATAKKMLLQGEEYAHKYLQTHRFLKEMQGCEWIGWPGSIPTLSMVFRGDLLPWQDDGARTSTLEDTWQRSHDGIPSASWTYSRDPGPDNKRCYSWGACLCRGHGRVHNTMFTRLRVQMKGAYVDNAVQTLLQNGYIILHWQGRQNPAEVANADTNSSDTCITHNLWSYVALHSEKPWGSTLVGMALSEDSVMRFRQRPVLETGSRTPQGDYFHMQPIQVHESFQIQTVVEWLATLDTKLMWHVQLWQLSERMRPLKDIVPCVAATPTDVTPFLIWAGRGHRATIPEPSMWQQDDDRAHRSSGGDRKRTHTDLEPDAVLGDISEDEPAIPEAELADEQDEGVIAPEVAAVREALHEVSNHAQPEIMSSNNPLTPPLREEASVSELCQTS